MSTRVCYKSNSVTQRGNSLATVPSSSSCESHLILLFILFLQFGTDCSVASELPFYVTCLDFFNKSKTMTHKGNSLATVPSSASCESHLIFFFVVLDCTVMWQVYDPSRSYHWMCNKLVLLTE